MFEKNYIQEKRKLESDIKKWKKETQLLIVKNALKEDKKKIKQQYKKERQKLPTSKFLMFFLFTSCSIVQIFTMYVTIKGMNMGLGANFGPLQMLITSIVGEVIGYAVYSLKALKQNTKGGIVYETALMNQNNENNFEEEANG